MTFEEYWGRKHGGLPPTGIRVEIARELFAEATAIERERCAALTDAEATRLWDTGDEIDACTSPILRAIAARIREGT